MDIWGRTSPSAMPFTQYGYPSIDEELVGFDNNAKKIIKKLVGGTREMDVISIVGMAGQGKTALARKVYNNPSIVGHFDVRAWCSISQTYNVRNLLLVILQQTLGDRHDISDYHTSEIADMLRKSLIAKRYLIVIDDVWEVEAWDDLRRCFPYWEDGSRIMVTSRNEELTRYIKYHSDPYLLPFLSDEDSWELLRKKVFHRENCPSALLNVGPLVAKKCNGMPFLIIMIAKVLSSRKREASFWLQVAYDISSYALEESMKMIQSSYDVLADHLKPCLLYMGLFPKGYQIPVSDLLNCWIAEEFVQNIDMLDVEETLKSWLNNFVGRNLVVISGRRANGEMKYCKVPDLVSVFCLKKIAEEKFMQLIVPYNPRQRLPSNKQRLCRYIHETMKSEFLMDNCPISGPDELRESSERPQKFLEFIAHPKSSILNSKNLFPLLHNLRLIRVLHLLDIYLDNSWAASFQSLTHLRFLAIFVKVFDFKWVSHLLHLQTLRVRSSYIMISSAIWKMEKLRHVDINEFPITWEDDERVNLEESTDVMLDNLKTLGVCYMSLADMTPKFWEKLPNLEKLRLHINEFGDVPNYSGCFDFPSRLKVLSLSDIFSTEEIVSKIARLKHLDTLKLSQIYFTGEKKWDLIDNSFYRLRVLKLHHVFMTRWICSDESFPVLETLVIKSCSKLEEIPFSFADIPSLRLVKVIDGSDSVGNSALNIKHEIVENEGFDRLQVQILNYDDVISSSRSIHRNQRRHQ